MRVGPLVPGNVRTWALPPFLHLLLGRGRGRVSSISVAGARLVHGSRAALGFFLGS